MLDTMRKMSASSGKKYASYGDSSDDDPLPKESYDEDAIDDDGMDDLERTPPPSKKEESQGVEELGSSSSSESTEIEIVEHVDEVDEGYYTPSILGLIILTTLVIGFAGLTGYGIYFGHEERNDPPTPVKVTRPPTSAPKVTDRVENGVCHLCPGGNITLFDAILGFDGNSTCEEVQILGSKKELNSTQCAVAQDAASTNCGCTTGTLSCPVCATGVIRNPDGLIDVSSAGFPGINQLTCGQLEGFSESGTIPEDSCNAIQEASVDVCDCGEDVCSVCPVGEVTNPSGMVNITSVGIPKTDTIACGELALFVKDGSLSNEQCVAVQEAAAEVCKCEA